jgi:hypothetical protein
LRAIYGFPERIFRLMSRSGRYQNHISIEVGSRWHRVSPHETGRAIVLARKNQRHVVRWSNRYQ